MAQLKLGTHVAQNNLLQSSLIDTIRFNQKSFFGLFFVVKYFIPHRTSVLLQAEDLESDRSYIVTANHSSMFDPFVITCSLPWTYFSRLLAFRYFAHNGLFHNILRTFLLAHGAFPASRSKRYAYGLEAARAFLANGQTVMIFPEGRRVTHSIRPRSGVEVMAKDPGVVVIPAHIEWRVNRFGWRTYRLTIGRPLKEKNLSAQQIMNRIYKLPLPELSATNR